MSLLGPLMVALYHRLVETNLWDLFTEVETKLVPILGAMEATGVQVDTEKLLHFDELLKLRIAHVESTAHKAAKRVFSINSTQQLRKVLFDDLQLDKQCAKKLSKTNILKHKSTSESVLHQLQDLHPLPRLVLEYRQLCKMKATYITGLLPFISEGVLHPCWQHTGAATGRLVSCSPNIQAFPKQPILLGTVKTHVVGKEGEKQSVEVRGAVVSRDGYMFVSTDFRSIELRLLAHLSGDPVLISALTTQPQHTSSCDVFAHLAAQWLDKSIENVTGGDRERAKRVVYAIVYGVGKDKLAEILGVSPNAAKELMTSFLSRFSQVKSYMQRMINEARRKGYVETICRRKRWFPHIDSGNPHLRSYSERQAINFPIQGSAADLCKCGMVQTLRMLARESPQTRLLLQIHDELLLEVPNQHVSLVSEKVKEVLESPDLIPSCKLKVPLEVRVTVGDNWAAVSSH
ncbi:DNA polymerase nu [Geodia barretti]|nr:DNA polymerase nu [Geodia barretti]